MTHVAIECMEMSERMFENFYMVSFHSLFKCMSSHGSVVIVPDIDSGMFNKVVTSN